MAQVNAWTAPINQAMNGMVTGFLQGTNSMRQIMARFGQSIVLSYGNMAAQAGMKWFNQRVVMAAWDRVFATQEVATTAAKEGAKTRLVAGGQAQQTAATRAGSTARAASSATEDAGFFSRIGQQLSEWLGFETARTVGTTTQAAARTSAETTAAMTAAAVAKAEAAAEIPAYAGIGAAAAMASVAAIPFVGWAMAPAVGAEHAALAMGYLGLASAEGGWGEVPKDGVLTELHKQEMVLPARFATPLREMLEGGGIAGAGMSVPSLLQRPANSNVQTTNNTQSQTVNGGSTAVHFHVSAIDSRGVAQFLKQHGPAIAKTVAGQARDFNKSAQRRP
jgi:hypothetical protein